MNINELEGLLPLLDDESGRAGQAVDLSTAVETFILDCQAGALSDATVRWYGSLLRTLLKAFPGAQLATISTNDLRRYMAALKDRNTRFEDAPQRPAQAGKLADASIIGHSTALHAFWAWCGKEYGIVNPMAGVKRPRRQKPTPKAIASPDFVALFDSCGEDEAGYRNRALLAFLGDAGVRAGELLSLTKDHLLLNEKQAVVSGKTGQRIVVYTKYTRALLALWLEERKLDSNYIFTSLTTGEPLTGSGLDQVLRRMKKDAGVTGRVNPHSFRHAFAREYLRAGGDVIRLAKLTGHESLDTLGAYYAIFTADELAEMHEDFSPLRRMMEAK